MTRVDPANSFLNTQRELPLGAGQPVEVWLDAGSIEIIGEQGAVALTMQHRMAGERLALDWNEGAAGKTRAA